MSNRIIDKDFCLSSYIAFRYIYKDDYDFFENFCHQNYTLKKDNKVKVDNANQMYIHLEKVFNNLYKKYNNIGILLSGGMDSAILASFLKPGSYAYTFSNKDTDIYNLDIQRSKKYCEKYKLNQKFVDITFNDYKEFSKIVMDRKKAPIHSIEPQIYKASIEAKKDGVQLMIIGDAADYVFGGMDKLLSRDWNFEEFINRYELIRPEKVLTNPVDVSDLFKPYIKNEIIDLVSFIEGPTSIESYGSYENAFACANINYYDPYEEFELSGPLDIERIRNGESKYLIRELYKLVYPEFEVPTKIPMPRPVDEIFKNWEGPKRKEFKKDIDMSELTGNQKWQLWCSEYFLNIYDKK